MAIQETDPLPYRSSQEQKEHEEADGRLRATRRRFLIVGSTTLAVGAALILSGKGEDVFNRLAKEDLGPTDEQKDAHKHLIVERSDVIRDLVLVGQPSLPSKLRNRPKTPTEDWKPFGKEITQIRETITVGDGLVVLGNDNKDPWIAILNPARDKNKSPEPKDIVFSHYGNFSLTPEQLTQVLKAVERLAS